MCHDTPINFNLWLTCLHADAWRMSFPFDYGVTCTFKYETMHSEADDINNQKYRQCSASGNADGLQKYKDASLMSSTEHMTFSWVDDVFLILAEEK